MAQPWRRAGIEPHVTDMLLDPIVLLLMTSDHVSNRMEALVLAGATPRRSGRPCAPNL